MRNIPIVGVNMETKQSIAFESIRQFARFVNAAQSTRCTAQRRISEGGGFVNTRNATWYVERIGR